MREEISAPGQAEPLSHYAHAVRAGGLLAMVVLLRAFANGCSAMTGTEAVSDGIPAFREPKAKNAALTLVMMGIILGTIFIGVTWLAMQLHVVYWEEHGRTAPAVIDQTKAEIGEAIAQD